MQSRAAISGAMIGLIISMSAVQASEVWVQQSRGRISGGTTVAEENKPAKAAPEGTATTAAAGSPVTPATCNQANASSTACYSATQQTRANRSERRRRQYLAITASLCSLAAATISGGTAFWCFSSSRMKASPAARSLKSQSLFFTPSKISE